MTKDTGKVSEVPEKAKEAGPKLPTLSEVGKGSMRGPAKQLEWTEEDQATLDGVQRLRGQQEKEQAELRNEQLREQLERRRARLDDIIQGKNQTNEGTVE